MRLRRLNNAVHRDLGYFLVGTTVLYALSGVALNHVDDWDPNFIIRRKSLELASAPKTAAECSREWVDSVLEPLGETAGYREHDFPSPTKVKIYLDDGSVFVDLATGRATYESVQRRPLFYRMNCLHVSPRRAWLVFSDLFAAALIVVAVTGLFVLPGRKGLARRGVLLAIAGLLVPLGFLYLIP